MKRFFLFLLLVFFVAVIYFPSVSRAQAQNQQITIYHFWSKYCPHCRDENAYLEKLKSTRSDLDFKDYEVSSDKNASELFRKFSDYYGNSDYGVPALFIGDKSFIGFSNEGTSGRKLVELIDSFKGKDILDPLVLVEGTPVPTVLVTPTSDSYLRKIPFIGEVDLRKYSLPVLTMVMGTVDGFNPCAMWALVALLSLLIAMGSRKKLLLVGGVFLISSWLIYYLFMMSFLNVFTFLRFGHLDLVFRIVIGAVAIYTSYSLYQSYRKETEECEVSRVKGRVHKQIRKLTETTFIPALIIGAVVLAVLVNLVEFMCSVNLPVIYTKILSLNHLSRPAYYLYLAAYNTLYMLDDIVVFLLAIFSMKAFTGFGNKYTRATKLIGAIVVGIAGILLLLYPQALGI